MFARTQAPFSNDSRKSDGVTVHRFDEQETLASTLKIQAAYRGWQARQSAAATRANVPFQRHPAETRATNTFESHHERVHEPKLNFAETDSNVWTSDALEALDEDVAVVLCEQHGLPWESMMDFEEVQKALKCHFGFSATRDDVHPMQAAPTESPDPFPTLEITGDVRNRNHVVHATDLKLADSTVADTVFHDNYSRVAELRGLRVRELEQIAQGNGLEQWEIDEALDSDQPKQALLALIILSEEAGISSLRKVQPELDANVVPQETVEVTLTRAPKTRETPTGIRLEQPPATAHFSTDDQPPSDHDIVASSRSPVVRESSSTDLAPAAAVAFAEMEAEVEDDSQPPSDHDIVASSRSPFGRESSSTDLAAAAAVARSDLALAACTSPGTRKIADDRCLSQPMTADLPAAAPMAVPRALTTESARPIFEMPRDTERAIDWLNEKIYPHLRTGLTALNDARCNSVSTAILDPLIFLADALDRSPEPAQVYLDRPSIASATSMLSNCIATVRPALLRALRAANTER